MVQVCNESLSRYTHAHHVVRCTNKCRLIVGKGKTVKNESLRFTGKLELLEPWLEAKLTNFKLKVRSAGRVRSPVC